MSFLYLSFFFFFGTYLFFFSARVFCVFALLWVVRGKSRGGMWTSSGKMFVFFGAYSSSHPTRLCLVCRVRVPLPPVSMTNTPGAR